MKSITLNFFFLACWLFFLVVFVFFGCFFYWPYGYTPAAHAFEGPSFVGEWVSLSHYEIKNSCAVVCRIGPQGWCGGTGRAAGGTGIKKSENKGLIVCWNKGNKMLWLDMSECLVENCPKGCLINELHWFIFQIAPTKYWIHNIFYFVRGTRMLPAVRICRNHCEGYSTTVLYFVISEGELVGIPVCFIQSIQGYLGFLQKPTVQACVLPKFSINHWTSAKDRLAQ